MQKYREKPSKQPNRIIFNKNVTIYKKYGNYIFCKLNIFICLKQMNLKNGINGLILRQTFYSHYIKTRHAPFYTYLMRLQYL